VAQGLVGLFVVRLHRQNPPIHVAASPGQVVGRGPPSHRDQLFDGLGAGQAPFEGPELAGLSLDANHLAPGDLDGAEIHFDPDPLAVLEHLAFDPVAVAEHDRVGSGRDRSQPKGHHREAEDERSHGRLLQRSGVGAMNCTVWSGPMPYRSDRPPLISSTYWDSPGTARGVSVRGSAFFTTPKIVRSERMKIMSKGISVFRIQKDCWAGPGKMKSMPCRSGMNSRNISPRARSAGSSATSARKVTGPSSV
jgi:hypothetical protein